MFQVPYKFSDQVAKITQRDIKNNKSLLPTGVVEIKGRFNRGDVISIVNIENAKLENFTKVLFQKKKKKNY